MSYSLNEIEALTKKAVRGAGLPWGMSEEAAKATRWLVSHGLPAAGLLADMLTRTDKVDRHDLAPMSFEGVWQAQSGQLCPVASGAALNDCAGQLAADQTIKMDTVTHPLLVVPFAAWAAIHIKATVRVCWQQAQLVTDGFDLRVAGPQAQIVMPDAVVLTCAKASDDTARLNTPALRGSVDDAAWAQLNAFAHRTYARATEESRKLGAGAGETDND